MYSERKSIMKKILKIVLSIIVIFVLMIAGAGIYLAQGLSGGSRLAIGSVDTSMLNDGVYSGKYEGGRWSNELKVTVMNHKITDIEVVKDVKIPKPEVTQEIVNNVIKAQGTDVDVVSGATVTSKAYLKAIENALKK